MRIAVAYDNGEIFQHFGRTEQFKVYDIEDGKVTSSKIVGTNGQGHGALAGVLGTIGADVLICGGIGAGAQNAVPAQTVVSRHSRLMHRKTRWRITPRKGRASALPAFLVYGRNVLQTEGVPAIGP